MRELTWKIDFEANFERGCKVSQQKISLSWGTENAPFASATAYPLPKFVHFPRLRWIDLKNGFCWRFWRGMQSFTAKKYCYSGEPKMPSSLPQRHTLRLVHAFSTTRMLELTWKMNFVADFVELCKFRNKQISLSSGTQNAPFASETTYLTPTFGHFSRLKCLNWL